MVIQNMDARCPECEKVAILDDDVTNVKCPHCNFEADYETYLEKIASWLPCRVKELLLLYRSGGSSQPFDLDTFVTKAGSLGPTLIICKRGHYIYGGEWCL